MGCEAGKFVVRFCLRFRDLKTRTDVDEMDRKMNEHTEDML